MLPHQNQNNKENKPSPAQQAGKRVAKKGIRKAGKAAWSKFGKAAAKKAVIGLGKGLLMVGKILLASLSSLGLPVFLVLGGLVILLLLGMVLSTSVFGGDPTEDLEEIDKERIEFIQEVSQDTVDWEKTEQRPYRVPEKLISAVVQFEIMKNDDTDFDKGLVRRMAKGLEPEFTYDTVEVKTETKVETCEGDSCTTSTEVSSESKEILSSVQKWDGIESVDSDGSWSSWSSTTNTEEKAERPDGTTPEVEQTVSKRTYQVSLGDKDFEKDYSLYDDFLNDEGYDKGDKQAIEAIYDSAGGDIEYSEWMEYDVPDFGGRYSGTLTIDGEIPSEFLNIYKDADSAYGISYIYLAAIHYETTGFSRTGGIMSLGGSVGPMGFPSKHWDEYGVDGNDDDEIEEIDLEDAVHSAANFLAEHGFEDDKRKALSAYMGDDGDFADKILDRVDKLESQMGTNSNQNNVAGSVPVSPGEITAPTYGYITSNYGPRGGKMHHGVDVGGAGNPIVSMADGVVYRSYLSSTYGNAVMIRHNIGGVRVDSVYAHMTTRLVSAGQQITKGTRIGYIGDTGRSTGPHLHFEIHLGGPWNIKKTNSVNPLGNGSGISVSIPSGPN